MADVIHRTTLVFLRSVHEPSFPEPTWKWDPDMSAVSGVPARYWKAPADWSTAGPQEMTQGEKDAVDAAQVAAALLASQTNVSESMGGSNEEVPLSDRTLLLRCAVETHNKLAKRILECERAFQAIKDTSGGSASIRAAIPAESVDGAAEAAPTTFTRLQERTLPNEIADFQDDVETGKADV